MKLRILFVDDDKYDLDSMRSMFEYMAADWDMLFSGSGEEALSLVKDGTIDVVIADMKMPDMDGAELLEKIKEIEPSVLRVVISGYSDKEMLMRATKSAHQFLPKPVNPQVLKKIIDKVYSLQGILKNRNIIKLTTSIKSLPALPDLYIKIEDELRRPNPSIKKIDDIISKDMVMTAKILQVVNSAFFGLPQRIINPLQAINFLGMEVIKALVLLVHFFSAERVPDFMRGHIGKLWDDSLKIATLAKKIAISEKFDSKKVEEAFIGSLLHDIGKLVLWQVPDYFMNIARQKNDFHISVSEAEYILYETSHAEVGAYLLGIWGLPDSLIEMVGYHHKPSLSQNKAFSTLTVLHGSDHLLTGEPLDETYLQNFALKSTINKWIRVYQAEHAVEVKEENQEENKK